MPSRKGQPEHGVELANALESLVALHDASTIAAVIVEPIAGLHRRAGAAQGYLQRLREICTKHGILLIFDEVITGFGRTGSAFASQEFGVTPDIITCAKGLTNGAVPMGAVIVKKEIHDAFMNAPEGAIELFHGIRIRAIQWPARRASPRWTSTNAKACSSAPGSWRPTGPMPCTASKACRTSSISGPMGSLPASSTSRCRVRPGKRGFETFLRCFEAGCLVRGAADGTALSPPLIVEQGQIDQLIDTLGKAIKAQ